MSEIIRDRKYRDNFRQVILKHLESDKEHFAFFPSGKDNILVSSLGRIINAATGYEYMQHKNPNGYMMVNLHHITKGRRNMVVHRVIAETYFSYLGPDNYFYEVNHINGNKSDNSIYNLEWLTRRENIDHGVKMRLFKNGQLTNTFNPEQQKDILDFYNAGCTKAEISRLYNVNADIITRVIKKHKEIK